MRKAYVVVGMLLLLGSLAVSLANTNEPSDSAFEPATVVSSVEPVYPATAVGSGTVVLAVSVDADGEERDVKVLSGSGVFLDSALEAIRGWKFKPALSAGKPVPSVIPVAFSFGCPIACAGVGQK